MNVFTAITTCKGRLEHLKQSLPLLCGLPDTQVVLVDYGCPQKCGEWSLLNHPAVKVIRVDDDTGFNPSRARNIGARQAGTDYLLFVDADVRIFPQAIEEMSRAVRPDSFLTIDSAELGNDIRGTCVIPRALFEKIGGYDEVLSSYGMEDLEIYTRLKESGARKTRLSARSFDVIHHGNELRTRYSGSRNLSELAIVALAYQEYVLALRRLRRGQQLPLETRKRIFGAIGKHFSELTDAADPSGGIRIATKLNRAISKGKIGSDMEWQLEFVMTLKPRDVNQFKMRYAK